jgi:hypothetical protein
MAEVKVKINYNKPKRNAFISTKSKKICLYKQWVTLYL